MRFKLIISLLILYLNWSYGHIFTLPWSTPICLTPGKWFIPWRTVLNCSIVRSDDLNCSLRSIRSNFLKFSDKFDQNSEPLLTNRHRICLYHRTFTAKIESECSCGIYTYQNHVLLTLKHPVFLRELLEKRRFRRRIRFSRFHRRSRNGITFDKTHYVVNISESAEPNTHLIKLSASDPDRTSIFYEMTSNNRHSAPQFHMNRTTGELRTADRLDRETIAVHELSITAAHAGDTARFATALVTVNVMDENDNSPAFEQQTYVESVSEDAQVGTTVMHMHAADSDRGKNAKLTYSLQMDDQTEQRFSIHPKTGKIEVMRPLDREQTAFYRLNVKATDSGNPPKSSYAIVQITVLDANDNKPSFSQDIYRKEIPENIDWKKKPVIEIIKATDPDSGDNGQIKYSIVRGNSGEKFSIGLDTGEIRLNGPLDHKLRTSYELIIRAQDSGTSISRDNTTILEIHVLDVNDHAPQFFTSPFQASVPEDSPLGSNILKIYGLDADSGQNALLKYSLVPPVPQEGEPIIPFPFDIDADSGWLKVTRKLDREIYDHYDFEAVATDAGEPPLSTSVTVVINVVDINDNAPRFESKYMNVSVYENATVGSQLDVRISAYDADQSTTQPQYAIMDGNDHQQFQIMGMETRAILAVNRPLDATRQSIFTLRIEARDAEGLSDSTTVVVTVLDVNSPPYFNTENMQHSVDVLEDAPNGTVVELMTAYDDDFGDNAQIRFKLDPEITTFAINETTGVMTVREPLDRETKPDYSIRVTVMDNGDPPLSSTSTLAVNILDMNDNNPVFIQPNYTIHVSEDVRVGHSLLTVSATDADLDHNSHIKYVFANGETVEGPFIIDESSGDIRIADLGRGYDNDQKPLDRERIGLYEFEVDAIDKGTPPLTGRTKVRVVVDDIDDNPPSFDQSKYTMFILENEKVGTVVGSVTARDLDLGPNADITFRISSGPDMSKFELRQMQNGNQVMIVSRDEFDFEARSPNQPFRFQLQASSGDKIQLASVDVLVYVSDVNDHQPNLEDFWIYLNNYDGHFPLHSIGKVPAHDPDENDTLTYTLIGGEDLIFIDGTNGEITLGHRLNTNRRISANMTVIVSDGVNLVSATLNLRVAHVSQDTLRDSVTIQILDVTLDDILDAPRFGRIVEALSTLGPSAREDVLVTSVQENDDMQNPSVNVTFSVYKPGTEELFSGIELSQMIHSGHNLVEIVGDIKFIVNDEQLCVREPCLHFQKCTHMPRYSHAPAFMATSNMLIRPINSVTTFSCDCPSGFASSTSKNQCDVEIDLCYSNPCGMNSTCMSNENGFVCICQDGYTGPLCDLPLSSEFCLPKVCAGNSGCAITSAGQMTCTNCPHNPKFATEFCELRARKFDGDAFVTFNGIKDRHRFEIEIRFVTVSKDGLLFYNGRYKEIDDFILVKLVQGNIEVTFSLGGEKSTSGILYSQNMRQKILYDGQWHTIVVQYFNKTLTLFTDDCDADIALRYAERISYPKCALKLEYDMHEKCTDPMVPCHRLFDMNGPLYIGGLPGGHKLSYFSKNFSGCIGDLKINHQLIDMGEAINNHNSLTGCKPMENGCLERKASCPSGNQCLDQWQGSTCSCKDGNWGRNCELPSQSYHLKSSDSYVAWNVDGVDQSGPAVIGMGFRTYTRNGHIMTAEFGNRNVLKAKICDSFLCIVLFQGTMKTLKLSHPIVSDGLWHNFQVEIGSSHVNVSVDSINKQIFDTEASSLFYGSINSLYTGRYPLGESIEPYFGCIQGAYISVRNSGSPAYLRMEDRDYLFTEEGCSGKNTCDDVQCPVYSNCVQGWNNHTCQCKPGYAGPKCIDLCQLDPCKNGGECQKTGTGFKCVCSPGYSGRLCDQKEAESGESCPSEWWGKPLCRPCRCHSLLGFSSDCDKFNGRCKCQKHHYLSPDLQKCESCGCYSGGSISQQCDIYGQCPCRGDAIGRMCDLCPSPKAQIDKQTGYCKEVQFGCPESFSRMILWPSSSKGSIVLEDCSGNSVGLAQRRCHDFGWSEPNLSNCSSKISSPLRQMLIKFQSGVKLTSSDLQRASTLLRNTTAFLTQTGAFPHMADLKISHDLMRSLIEQEMKEERQMAMTHFQDHKFIIDLVTSASALLSPENSRYWHEMGNGDVWKPIGSFLQFLDNYGTLLSSLHARKDTYLKPFQVVAKNLVFAVEKTANTVNAQLNVPKMNHATETQAHVNLARGPTTVFSALYTSLNKLTSLPGLYSTHILSPVISLAASDENGKNIKNFGVSGVKILLPVTVNSLKDRPMCVWWMQESESWKHEGCEFSWWNQSHGLCQCDHLTTFTIINSPQGFVISSNYLFYLMAFGTGLSVVFLLITLNLLIFCNSDSPISPSHKLSHSCLIMSLIINVSSFFAVYSASKDSWLCPLSGSLVHFSTMACILWLLGSLLSIYKMATEPLHTVRNMKLWPLVVLGLFVPFLIALCSAMVGYTGLLESNRRCYFDVQDPLIWTLLVPICLAIIMCGYTSCVCLAVAWSSEWNLLLAKMNFRGVLVSYFIVILLVLVTGLLQVAMVNWPWQWLTYAYVISILITSLAIFVLLYLRGHKHYDFRLVPGELWMNDGQNHHKDNAIRMAHSPDFDMKRSPRPCSPFLSEDLAPRNEEECRENFRDVDHFMDQGFNDPPLYEPAMDLYENMGTTTASTSLVTDPHVIHRPRHITASIRSGGTPTRCRLPNIQYTTTTPREGVKRPDLIPSWDGSLSPHTLTPNSSPSAINESMDRLQNSISPFKHQQTLTPFILSPIQKILHGDNIGSGTVHAPLSTFGTIDSTESSPRLTLETFGDTSRSQKTSQRYYRNESHM